MNLRFVIFLAGIYSPSSVEAINKDQLGIRLDDTWARRPGGAARLLYGSIVQIRGLSTWDDKEIVDLAMAAHSKVVELWREERARRTTEYPDTEKESWKNPPGVTSTLVIGDSAYISSTIKGGLYLYTARGTNPVLANLQGCEPVTNALQRCQLENLNSDGLQVSHRHAGNCGEQMAALAYCTSLGTAMQPDFTNARIVAIRTSRATKKPAIAKPCAREVNDPAGTWGCQNFVSGHGSLSGRNTGIYVIPEGTDGQAREVADADITVTYATYP